MFITLYILYIHVFRVSYDKQQIFLNRLIFLMEERCLLWGTNWMFMCNIQAGYSIGLAPWGNTPFCPVCFTHSPFWLIEALKKVTHCLSFFKYPFWLPITLHWSGSAGGPGSLSFPVVQSTSERPSKRSPREHKSGDLGGHLWGSVRPTHWPMNWRSIC